jgi:hypothetical protein
MFHYYLKKIQYFILGTKFVYPKTIVEFYYCNKKKNIISFSSIGKSKRVAQTNEFFNLTKNFNVLFVKDVKRSWFNSLDVNYIKSFLPKNGAFCIGHSMGAFNAIMFSNFFPIKKVIAFSPQFSVHPLVSRDKTYLNYAALIDQWKYKKIRFNRTTKYYLIFGDSTQEKYHMNQMPNQKNIKKIIVKNCDHNTAPILKKRGELYSIIKKLFIDKSRF